MELIPLKAIIYLPGLADQTKLFLLSLGFGFALGLLYDAFRIIRLLFAATSKAEILIADIVYVISCTVLSFLFFLSAGDGTLRVYGVFGELLGWAVYYFSLGAFIFRISAWITDTIHRIIGTVVRMVCTPFIFLYQKLQVLGQKFSANAKKVHQKNKFRLTYIGKMCYNYKGSRVKKRSSPRRKKKSKPTSPPVARVDYAPVAAKPEAPDLFKEFERALSIPPPESPSPQKSGKRRSKGRRKAA
ncbi:MAG: spore cortex biosynthesis protein YabQ [Oscillospiraceae bacterium]|jgi:hypothetical protein|nr:spore cortex biosynthesis protein YabQ [Oscillospiraceae bacterium]